MKASIIVPTRNRSTLLLARMRTLERNTPELFDGSAELIFSIDVDDGLTLMVIKDWFPYAKVCMNKQLEIPALKWNNAAAEKATGDWLVTISDDSVPHPNWLTNALATINQGFIGLPDGVTGYRNNYFTPLYMATRDWLKRYNGGVLVIPHYKCWYADIETAQRAHRSRTYFVGWNSVVEQLHSVFKTAPDDEIYKIGVTRRVDDLKTFEERSKKNFPDDFKSIL